MSFHNINIISKITFLLLSLLKKLYIHGRFLTYGNKSSYLVQPVLTVISSVFHSTSNQIRYQVQETSCLSVDHVREKKVLSENPSVELLFPIQKSYDHSTYFMQTATFDQASQALLVVDAKRVKEYRDSDLNRALLHYLLLYNYFCSTMQSRFWGRSQLLL